METIVIKARNNLGIPVRLTITNSGYTDESQIRITIGKEGVKLAEYYRVCVEADILPSGEWGEVGALNIKTKSTVSFNGNSQH